MLINYGDYENHKAQASVKGTFSADADPDELASYMDERVFSLLAPQLAAAKDYAIDSSFVDRIPTD